MHYHQATTNQTEVKELRIITCYKYELVRPSNGIVSLANLKVMYIWSFICRIRIYRKCSIQVCPCTAEMQKLEASYVHSSFFYHLLICHHRMNASNRF